MDSNSSLSIRLLPDGTALLCDESGTAIACNSSGELLLSKQGRFMNVEQARLERGTSRPQEERKPDLSEYRQLVALHLNPRLNLRTQQIETVNGALTEEEFENLNVWFVEHLGLKFRKGDLQSTVRAAARKSEYDPIHTYLSGLGVEGGPILTDEEWDQISVLTLGLSDSWSRTVVQRFLLSAVARVMEPGCKVDFCLILFGQQGLGKSSFFASLAGESFSDSMGDLSNKKDDLLILHRNWFNEWSEADQIFVGAHRAEQIKRFVSAKEDTFRAPYGRTTQSFERRSILCGTTNRDDWANDPTGNRRFPVLSPTAIDVDWITANRDRIWARVAVEWRKGTRWWFSKEEEAIISSRAQEFAPLTPIVEEVWEFLQVRQDEDFSVRELWGLALGRDQEQLSDQVLRQTSRVLRQLEARGVSFTRKNHMPRNASYGKRSKSLVLSLVRQ